MAAIKLFLLFNFLFFLCCATAHTEPPPQHSTYIVQLDNDLQKPSPFPTHKLWHLSLVQSLTDPIADEELFLYSYTHVMHGFSCRLTEAQVSEIETWPTHVATYPVTFGKLLTTHTPDFLGLRHDSGLWPNSSYGEGVIIGFVDTGIWPSSESFHDRGMPAIPERWKGKCEEADDFNSSYCNRKLIGSRFFLKGAASSHNSGSVRIVSHGSHVSSTAAGNFVPGVSYSGYAKGTARGVAPRAHIAMYRVGLDSDDDDIVSANVLAAIDQAIADGVDIISLSVGFEDVPYHLDPVAIGSLSAAEKGIFVAAAAGNTPSAPRLLNGPPWMTTVGAGTIDRSFTASMTLSNGVEMQGYSYFPLDISTVDAPLYYRKGKSGCHAASLNRSQVAGKMILCDNATRVEIAFDLVPTLNQLGAFGAVLITDQPADLLDPVDCSIPLIAISQSSGDSVRKYATDTPGAKVQSLSFQTTNLGVKPAPQVASFSCKGPDQFYPGILKPDILAPGFEILAAFSRKLPYMSLGGYRLMTNYGILSGTSMAAPHIAGVAALLKSAHPEWSPAALRSAMMTTAYTVDNTGQSLTEQFTGLPMSPINFGAGHIDPNRAMDPGLIYDIQVQDYIDFLCGQNLTRKQIDFVLQGRGWHCSKRIEVEELNYPSLTAVFKPPSRAVEFSRTLTNVGGDRRSVYRVSVENAPPAMRIEVVPETLVFRHRNETNKFHVHLEVEEGSPAMLYCFLRWSDGDGHVVSSPIVALTLDDHGQ